MIFDERKFVEVVEPHIQRCRNGDWNHAKRVVKWIKELGSGRSDLYLLITTGYMHDIGWRDVLPPQKLSFEKLLEYEPQANKNSKPFIKELLASLDYSSGEIDTVLKLVAAADKHKSDSDDEAIIVDADNLSKLDINHLNEKFQENEWMKMYNLWKEKFPKRIKTSKGGRIYPSLLEKLRGDIQESDNTK